ncbi:PstS family phosphate ABC transporter substrate-binding protein [Candidatus Halobonum tyrrellensis]|uniref:Phosphate ABC transporter substrate-binding protein, phot family n=1 Tax=Candidatus Halobonum tyrrellensis G22 TaxID=1324957 RepID=V4HK23_9EURY|nr:substrate-binding domain-containing protein [Candidatus Halobonum tyrrellensis]ESP88274.1 phosphate ABC transporter substrate-binding protein, phot family [Candidatus Halobonum tyrrellensis G22]
MANEPVSSAADRVSRRKFVVAASAAGIAGVAGCTGGSGESGTDTGGGTDAAAEATDTSEASAQPSNTSTSTGQAQQSGPLTADGSSTVYPITSLAGSYWNSNPPASDEEYWGPGQYDIDTEQALADYWAGLYGLESGAEGKPPFKTSIGLSHSGTGLEKLRNGQVDIGDSSAPVSAEFPDASESELEPFTNHVVGVDAQPIVVSKAIYDAGVEKLTVDQLRKIYTGEIENWSGIESYSGPDKEIQAVGRAVGSGTDTAFRLNVFGNPDAEIPGVDVRKGQNQQVQSLVSKSNNAIAYLALAFVDQETVPPVALEIEGTTYRYGENLGAKEYPLSRDLHAYTWEDTSKKEAAFLRMILSDYGQEKFVASSNYVTLTDARQEEEMGKLPSTDA